MIETEDKNFFVSGNSGFNERQKSIFDSLDKVEKDKPQNRYTEEEFKESEAKLGRVVTAKKKDMKQFQGKESIFKRPEVPMLKNNWKKKMPDFKMNPHKWTKYSLDTVNLDDMSDKKNTATAMSFLHELSNRSHEPMEQDANSPFTHIKFKKRMNMTEPEVQENATDKPKFISGKYTMPEYIIGQKAPTKKAMKKVNVEIVSKSTIKLDHLLDQDKEED